MFYEPTKETSGLPHNPFTACCVPRPIGWLSTVSTAGVHNLAPFAQFQNVTFEPPTVLFSVCGWPAKDTLTNALETGEFVWNMATFELREKVAASAVTYPPEVNEFEALDLETLPSRLVKPLRVAASPVHFECCVRESVDIPSSIPEGRATIVIGHVVGVHIRDDALTEDGRVDVGRLRPLARLGYLDYTSVEAVFEIDPYIPDDPRWRPDAALRGTGNVGGLFHMPEVPHGEEESAAETAKTL
jgi:flavin reductase (DIM6/NTAB) family NADH-FMN oxidoreductase RutF